MRYLLIQPDSGSNSEFHVTAKESVAEFIRLCFRIYPGLSEIYWNIHPENVWMAWICEVLAFEELPQDQSIVSRGVRYRSFVLDRLK